MGFTNQERTNFASKVLAGGVIDANEVAQWYESRFPNEFVLDARKVWTELELVRGYPAANITTARTYCSGVLLNVVEDKTATAIRLTPVPGTNSSTWAAYNIFGDASSERLDNWLQPQQVPQLDGSPSIGYSVALYDGNPATSGTQVTTTAGTTGAGASKSVGWMWNYANGLLFLSADFRTTLTNPDLWIKGFRYVGQTIQDYITTGSSLTGSYAPDDATFILLTSSSHLANARTIQAGTGIILTDNTSSKTLTVSVDPTYIQSLIPNNNSTIATLMSWNEVPVGVVNNVNTTFTLSHPPSTPYALSLYMNGQLLEYGASNDYVLSSSTITTNFIPGRGKLLATYPYIDTSIVQSYFEWNETVSGSIDGVNTAFSIAYPPSPPESLSLFFNGILMEQGVLNDYILTGSSITMNFAPNRGKLKATYQR